MSVLEVLITWLFVGYVLGALALIAFVIVADSILPFLARASWSQILSACLFCLLFLAAFFVGGGGLALLK